MQMDVEDRLPRIAVRVEDRPEPPGRNAALARFDAMMASGDWAAAGMAGAAAASAVSAGATGDAGIAGVPLAGVGVRNRSSRADERRPSVSVMRPSVASSWGKAPVATCTSART